MVLFTNGEVEIATITKPDKQRILQLFSENNFNCDYETAALRPSNAQLSKIMDDIISGKDDESNMFVLKKAGVVIGYISMFVEYSRLKIGHIAVDKDEQGQGYGSMLINMAVKVAENEGREVGTFCMHRNSCFAKLGFKTSDGIHYLHHYQGIKSPELPQLFIGVQQYKEKKDREMEEELESFTRFLKSGFLDL